MDAVNIYWSPKDNEIISRRAKKWLTFSSNWLLLLGIINWREIFLWCVHYSVFKSPTNDHDYFIDQPRFFSFLVSIVIMFCGINNVNDTSPNADEHGTHMTCNSFRRSGHMNSTPSTRMCKRRKIYGILTESKYSKELNNGWCVQNKLDFSRSTDRF